MKIEFIEAERIPQDNATRYWFAVDGAEYCIHDSTGELSLLDACGYPIDDCNDHGQIKPALVGEVQYTTPDGSFKIDEQTKTPFWGQPRGKAHRYPCGICVSLHGPDDPLPAADTPCPNCIQ